MQVRIKTVNENTYVLQQLKLKKDWSGMEYFDVGTFETYEKATEYAVEQIKKIKERKENARKEK